MPFAINFCWVLHPLPFQSFLSRPSTTKTMEQRSRLRLKGVKRCRGKARAADAAWNPLPQDCSHPSGPLRPGSPWGSPCLLGCFGPGQGSLLLPQPPRERLGLAAGTWVDAGPGRTRVGAHTHPSGGAGKAGCGGGVVAFVCLYFCLGREKKKGGRKNHTHKKNPNQTKKTNPPQIPTPHRRKGTQRRAENRRRGRRRPGEEEEAAAAADPLHQPAAAGAGGHLPAESLPGHVHPGGDRRLDQPHRGQG